MGWGVILVENSPAPGNDPGPREDFRGFDVAHCPSRPRSLREASSARGGAGIRDRRPPA